MGRFVLLGLLVSAACAREQAPDPACVGYVACVRARDQQRNTTTNVDRFAEQGACWTAASEGAASCAAACVRGLDVMQRLPDRPAECQP